MKRISKNVNLWDIKTPISVRRDVHTAVSNILKSETMAVARKKRVFDSEDLTDSLEGWLKGAVKTLQLILEDQKRNRTEQTTNSKLK